MRRAAGKGKLDFLAIDQCHACRSNDLLLAGLELAKEVRGYTDLTMDPLNGYRLGKKYIYRTPQDVYADDAVVRAQEGYVGKKGKRPSKVASKNKYKNMPDTK